MAAEWRAAVCALVPYPLNTAPSQRFRTEQWAVRLRAEQIRCDFLPLIDTRLMRLLHTPGHQFMKGVALGLSIMRRLAVVRSLRAYDAVLIHRSAALAGPALIERMLARRRRIIFDFDDAVFISHTTAANRHFRWLKFPRKTSAICRISSHVIAGNDYLASYARRFNPRVTVIPSSVDTDAYRPGKRNAGDRLVVGWMGTATSQTHLEQFAPVLREVTRRWPVEIRVVSDQRPSLSGVPAVWHPWSLETELDELQAFDIGIMPIPDDEFAQGKCSMKALLYMSVGLPVVCSPVGMNRVVVQHGQNGLLAGSRDEWLDCLGRLVSDERSRKDLGDAGRVTVEEKYSSGRCAQLFASVVRDTVGAER